MGTWYERAFVISCVDLQRFLFQPNRGMECALQGSRWDSTKAPCLSSCPHVASPTRHLSGVGAGQSNYVGVAPGSARGMIAEKVEQWVYECRDVGARQGWDLVSLFLKPSCLLEHAPLMGLGRISSLCLEGMKRCIVRLLRVWSPARN